MTSLYLCLLWIKPAAAIWIFLSLICQINKIFSSEATSKDYFIRPTTTFIFMSVWQEDLSSALEGSYETTYMAWTVLILTVT